MTEAWIGRLLKDLPTPALVVDLDQFEQNLECMRRVIALTDVRVRPHAKTHKSPLIAQKQLAMGAEGICCAKLGEAEIMSAAGISNILITSPVVGGKIDRLVALAQKGQVSVVVDHPDVVRHLSNAAKRAQCEVDVIIEVDVGQRRCGVTDQDTLKRLVEAIEENSSVTFCGLQGYQGKLQLVSSYAERRSGVEVALEHLMSYADVVRRQHGSHGVLTGGGTGTLPFDLEFQCLDELQPGSYVFMDSRYRAIEWSPKRDAPPFTMALFVLGTVVSTAQCGKAVLDTGWKALSNDGGAPLPLDYPDARFSFGGDEHGVLEFAGRQPLRVGDVVRLGPSHCDTTVNLFDAVAGIRDGFVESVWPVAARGRTQ